MTQPQMIPKQEALLGETLEIAQLFEQKAKELSDLSDAFAQKWEKRLHDAEAVRSPNLRN